MTVGPAEVLTRRLYTAAAIGLALALFAVSRLAPRAVRALVSPFRVLGPSGADRWPTLLRWCSAVRAGCLFTTLGAMPAGWPSRRAAERAAMMLASYAVPSPDPPPLTSLAFVGAARAR